MKVKIFILFAILGVFFFVSACQGPDEKGKNDYSGVAKLITERNKARNQGGKNLFKKSDGSGKLPANNTQASVPSNKKKFLSIILYEEDVKIVGSKSGRTLAKGVAYINKQGQIVKIKILKK